MYEHAYRFMLLFSIIIFILSIATWGLLRKGHSSEVEANIPSKKINLTYFIAFAIILALYVTLIPMWEDFTYQDNDIFFRTLFNGAQWYRAPVWLGAGRLFPLAHQEWALIAKVSASNFAYHFFAVIEVIFFCFLMVKLFGGKISLFVSLLLLASPPFVQSFYGLIYPERNMIILLSLIILAIRSHSRTGTLSSLILLSAATCAFLFYKETSFLIIYGLAASSLLYYFITREKQVVTITVTLFVSASLWLATYVFFIMPEIQDAYGKGLANVTHVLICMSMSPVTYMSIVSMGIFAFNLKMKSIFSLMPVIAIGYSFTMYMLSFDMPYYHAPSLLMAVISLFLATREIVWVAVIILSFSTLATANNSIEIIKTRKEMVSAKADAAKYIATISKTNGMNNISISFINSDPYENMLFYGYIENKYKIKVSPLLNEKCSTDVNFVVSFSNQVSEKDLYTYKTSDIPMWKNKYSVYVINCTK